MLGRAFERLGEHDFITAFDPRDRHYREFRISEAYENSQGIPVLGLIRQDGAIFEAQYWTLEIGTERMEE